MVKGKVGVGVIGCGVVANYHTSAVQERGSKAVLVGVADRNYERSVEFAKKHNTKAFANFGEMLDSPEVDVISICTPSGLHAEAAVKCANAGKHLVIEKPIGITKEQLDNVENAVKENNVKATCILQSRYYRSIRKVKRAIDEELLGKTIFADVLMKYNRTQEYYDSAAWRGTWELDGGGALMNQGIHGIDLMLYFIGGVKSVFAYSKTLRHNIEVEDTLSCTLEFENGALGSVVASTSITPGYPRLMNIHGEKGTIRLEENSIVKWDIERTANEEDLVITPSGFTAANTPTAISADGHLMQIEDIVDAILYKKSDEHLIGISEARKSVDLILAIYESARTGKQVYL